MRLPLILALVLMGGCAFVVVCCKGAPKIPAAQLAISGVPVARDVLPTTRPATSDDVTLQIRLDAARAELARKAAELDAANERAARAAQATIDRKKALASRLFWVGIAVSIAGLLAAWKVNLMLGVCGFVFGVALTALPEYIEITAGAVEVGAYCLVALGVGLGLMQLWIRWQTNRQAAEMERLARINVEAAERLWLAGGAEDVVREIRANAGARLAAAKYARHIGTPGFDPSRTDASTEAVALITGANA